MIDFRCGNCNKLLGRIEGRAEIKCPKCKTMNQLGYEKDVRIDDNGYYYLGARVIGWVAPGDRHLKTPPLWSGPEMYQEFQELKENFLKNK